MTCDLCKNPSSRVLSDVEKEVIEKRACVREVFAICDRDYTKYYVMYSLNIKFCCDPFDHHNTKKVIGRHVISLENSRAWKLIPGNKLCYHCVSECNEKTKKEEDSEHFTSDSEPFCSQQSTTSDHDTNNSLMEEIEFERANKMFVQAGISPISRTVLIKTPFQVKRKIDEVGANLRKKNILIFFFFFFFFFSYLKFLKKA